MIESKRVTNSEQYVATYVNVTCVRDVDKEKHITRSYPDVSSTLFSSRSYVNATSAYTRVTCFFLVDVTHVTFTQDGTHYSDLRRSIMAAVRYESIRRNFINSNDKLELREFNIVPLHTPQTGLQNLVYLSLADYIYVYAKSLS